MIETMAPTHVIGADGLRVALAGGKPVEEGDAVVMTTSGSAGAAKAVVLTHSAVEASARATSEALGVRPDLDCWLACLPLAHIGGLSVVTRALLTGTRLIVHPAFEAAAVMRAADDGADLVSLVPTALGRVDATAFRRILVGGAAPPSGLPPNAVTTYGMTETGSGVVYDGFALPGVEMAIEGDRDEGQIMLRGPMLLRCYRDGSDPKSTEGWLPTGDAGAIDENGKLSVMGRIAEVIVTGGEKVWPANVEEVVARTSGVAQVVVVGIPDVQWGSSVVAIVVPAIAESPPALGEIRQIVKDELSPWAAPKELVVVDELPRLPGGKVDRRAARRIAADQIRLLGGSG
jgi:O-succinylbenzoic acid--CoA ligase